MHRNDGSIPLNARPADWPKERMTPCAGIDAGGHALFHVRPDVLDLLRSTAQGISLQRGERGDFEKRMEGMRLGEA
ncbi:hypothetical protein D3C72_2161630 [compost metagenome]